VYPTSVDVAALQVLEDRDGADGEVLAPVGRHPGVGAAVAVALDHRDKPVELGALGSVRAALGADGGAVNGGRRRRAEATRARALRPQQRPRPPRTGSQANAGPGFEQAHATAASHAAPRPASSSAASCTPIMKRRKKRSRCQGTTLDEGPERRATRKANSRAHAAQRHQQGAGVGERRPGQPRHSEPEQREHGPMGKPAVVEQLPRDQASRALGGAVSR